jgi:hypothetical protein
MSTTPEDGRSPDSISAARRLHIQRGEGGASFPPPLEDTDGFNLRPDPLQAATSAELMRLLRQFRAWCGLPGYRVMSSRVGKQVSPSTLCTALGGDRLPKLDTLQAIIRACSGSEQDVRRWTTAWRQITLAESPESQRDQPPPIP